MIFRGLMYKRTFRYLVSAHDAFMRFWNTHQVLSWSNDWTDKII